MKKTFRILFAVVLALSMCVVGSALTLDIAESAAQASESEEAVLSAVSTTTVPGINLLTGTTDVLDFEEVGMSSSDIISKTASVTHSISDAKAYSGSKSLAGVSGSQYVQIYFKVPVEKDRKYYIAGKTIATTGYNSYILWPAQQTEEDAQKTFETIRYTHQNNVDGVWMSFANTYTAVSNKQFYFQNMSKNGETVYFDDLAIIPYYKITYIGLDGETVAATDYALYDDNGNLLKYYTPDYTLVEGATAFSLTPDGQAENGVVLANADITLYARNDISPEDTSFTDGEGIWYMAVTGDKFIMPYMNDVALSFDKAYLNLWTDGTNYYYPGDVVDKAAVKGRVFTAITNDFSVFDETKGYLMFNIDAGDIASISTSGDPATVTVNGYVNPKYGFTNTFRMRNDYGPTRSVIDDNGNKVLKETTKSNAGYHLGGLAATVSAEELKGSIATSEFDIKFIDCIANYTKMSLRMQYTYADGKHLANATITDQISGKNNNEWIPISYSMEDSSNNGFVGSYFQFSKTASADTIYTDNFKAWAFPDTVAFFKSGKTAEDWVKFPVDKTQTTFTMPTLEEAGMNEDNFIAWTDGINYYKAGIAYALDEIEHKIFYPFCQDASKPAVATIFEGDSDIGEGDYYTQGYKYKENIVDEGRSVFHMMYRNSNKGDIRINIKQPNQFDVSEYNILSFMVKADGAWKTSDSGATYTDDSTADMVFYAHNAADGITISETLNVLKKAVNVSNSYTYVEENLANNSKWNTNAGGYGFWITLFDGSNYGGSTYIDYIRVYRAGITTVTYETNEPAGATVVYEVPADTNRGLGTGYLLKDLRPEVEGYQFMGWATKPDATADETVEAIDLTGDTTVYAVWEKAENLAAPEMTGEVEIKGTGTNNGIRFKAEIMPSVKENLDEFGFLATREVLLPYNSDKTARDYTALTFLHKAKDENANYFVKGVAYDADGDIDVINGDADDGSIVYTAVVTGIPLANKKETMVVRSYAKFDINSKEMTVYGNAVAASLYDVADEIAKENSESYIANQTYIDSILAE